MQKQGSGAVVLLAMLTFGGIVALFSQAGISNTNAQSRLNPGSHALPSEVPHALYDAGARFSQDREPHGETTAATRRLRLECE